MIGIIKNYLQKMIPVSAEKPVVEAYDIWSGSYDSQPGNLVLDLDEQLFSSLIENIDFKNKRIADIGCGTGRHWQKIYARRPNLIIGFDVSEGMLNQLKQKFPQAITQHTTDNTLRPVPCAFIDCIISTLTIAHMKNIEEAIAAWARVIKPNGELVITDFHPATLSKGGKRSFNQNGNIISVLSHVHPLNKILHLFKKYGFTVIARQEKFIDDTVRHYYETQNALHVYNRFKGMPVIYGLHLKKVYAAE